MDKVLSMRFLNRYIVFSNPLPIFMPQSIYFNQISCCPFFDYDLKRLQKSSWLPESNYKRTKTGKTFAEKNQFYTKNVYFTKKNNYFKVKLGNTIKEKSTEIFSFTYFNRQHDSLCAAQRKRWS